MTDNNIAKSDDYEPFCHGNLANPYPFYHRLRSQDAVHWCEPLCSWILTKHADVTAALRDPRLASDRAGFYVSQAPEPLRPKLRSLGQHLSKWVVLSDPPDHTRLRLLVSKAFTPRTVENLRVRIEEVVDGLLGDVEKRGEADLVSDFAYHLPATVICEMLGVPSADRDAFRQWTEDINAFGGGSSLEFATLAEQAQDSLLKMSDYFQVIITERRHHPQDDLISAMIKAQETGDMLTDEEILSMCSMLFVAGHDTTRNLIGNGMLALMQNPDQREKLTENPSLISSAVEELLRFDSPLQRQTRIAKENIDLSGRLICKGQPVLAMLGAANRDPASFSDPDRLDICRRDNRHVAFGSGIHFCLGAPLARLEAQIAICALLRRLPSLRLVSDSLEWRHNMSVRGLESLPVVFHRRVG